MDSSKIDRFRRGINLAFATLGVLATVILIWVLWTNRFDPVLADLAVKNFAAIIGLPFSCMAAFIIVTLFRQGESQIELEAWGFKFKGAAGEIVLWNLCFWGMIGAINLLWGRA